MVISWIKFSWIVEVLHWIILQDPDEIFEAEILGTTKSMKSMKIFILKAFSLYDS